MYHIKNDKRCLRSAALIADALERLLDQKIFADISVSDLQRESGVGRSTFYRLFDNIDDVVTYLVDEKFKDGLDSSQLFSVLDLEHSLQRENT